MTLALLLAAIISISTPPEVPHGESVSSSHQFDPASSEVVFDGIQRKSDVGGICADLIQEAEDRCRSLCDDGAYTFDSGICGIGSKCSCDVSTENPPDP